MFNHVCVCVTFSGGGIKEEKTHISARTATTGREVGHLYAGRAVERSGSHAPLLSFSASTADEK